MGYIKLQKIKRLIEENQHDMKKPISHEEWLVLYETHKHLKEMEIALVQKLGTVIVK
jgi:DNA primase